MPSEADLLFLSLLAIDISSSADCLSIAFIHYPTEMSVFSYWYVVLLL